MAGYLCPMPIGILNANGPYLLPLTSFAIAHSEKWRFVKEYSNFDPQKQGVLTTKGALGQKNAIFCGFR